MKQSNYKRLILRKYRVAFDSWSANKLPSGALEHIKWLFNAEYGL